MGPGNGCERNRPAKEKSSYDRSSGGQRHCHRKLYAFEHRHIECGNRFTVFDTAWGVRIGILTGADNYLIENVRMTALMGATLLVAPHRSYGVRRAGTDRLHAESSKHGFRVATVQRVANMTANPNAGVGESGDAAGCLRRWLPARAGDNGMFIAFSDGVGIDNESEPPAHTATILDPCGRILAESTAGSCGIVAADLDSTLIDQSIGRQWLMRRRPSLYGALTQMSSQASNTAEPRRLARGGSIALSFAVVGRDRLTG
jgi:predicted amidohydrolase